MSAILTFGVVTYDAVECYLVVYQVPGYGMQDGPSDCIREWWL